MRKTFHNLLTTALLATAIAGPSSPAAAGETFGLNAQWKFIHATQFQLSNPQCGWNYWSFGHHTISALPGGTCSAPQARANVELPEGSMMTGFHTFYYSSAGSITAYLVRYQTSLANGAPDVVQVGGALNTTKTTGYAVDFKSLGALSGGIATYPIYKTYDPVGTGTERDYQFVVGFPANPSTLGFKGIAIMYQRQIAPAPASAAFDDVPTTHPFFNEVEQLKKSGITLGCGGSNFCPDSPVTRGQMAAFLSRALGLQWDWNTNAP